jgi:glucose/arabinose dehydrogenase
MKNFLLLILGLLFFILTSCNHEGIQNQQIINTVETELVLSNYFPDQPFEQPVDIQSPQDGTDRLFIVEKAGVIKVVENTQSSVGSIFLSISDNVDAAVEKGLLGLAFHPDFETNGYFYINYNPIDTEDIARISRFKVSNDNQNIANSNSEFVVLEYNQPFVVHKGGQLTFGHDGNLYISSGDGGNSNNGQDLQTFTGNILRIDIDNPESGLNYGIPNDNPFLNDNNALNEIYAYGFRNPWRMNFDIVTGQLWVGDVGEGQIEEIDIIESGNNYGWSFFEGTECNFGSCDTSGLTFPVFEYEHDGDSGSITGGYVYRGTLNADLIGKYIYGDFNSGKIWALDINTFDNELLFDTEIGISTFGVDKNNEIYVTGIYDGLIYKLEQQIVE